MTKTLIQFIIYTKVWSSQGTLQRKKKCSSCIFLKLCYWIHSNFTTHRTQKEFKYLYFLYFSFFLMKYKMMILSMFLSKIYARSETVRHHSIVILSLEIFDTVKIKFYKLFDHGKTNPSNLICHFIGFLSFSFFYPRFNL